MAKNKDYPKFESMDEIRSDYLNINHEYELAYNGQEFFLSQITRNGKDIFTIAANLQNENPIEYDSFDEMLDGFKEKGGKPLREFILEAEILCEY